MIRYWLVKSEPSVYSWDQFVKDEKTDWSGVRNFQAANNLKAMNKGDQAFFYHSNEGKEIVGIAEVAREAYPDPSDEKGRFVMVDLKPVKAFKNPVTLARIKADAAFKNMALLKQSRLSVCPVTEKEWQNITRISEGK